MSLLQIMMVKLSLILEEIMLGASSSLGAFDKNWREEYRSKKIEMYNVSVNKRSTF